MTEQAVRGKTLIVTTTNGTKALLAAQGAAAVYVAAAVNLTVAGERARAGAGGAARRAHSVRGTGGGVRPG